MWEHFRRGLYADCAVVAGRRGWSCHRIVLSSRSAFFEAAFAEHRACAASAAQSPGGGSTSAGGGAPTTPADVFSSSGSSSQGHPVVRLPFPEEACAAFDDLLPYLYDPEMRCNVDLDRAVPLLVLAALVGMPALCARLTVSLLDAAAASPAVCAAALAYLTAPWLAAAAGDDARPFARDAERRCRLVRGECGRLLLPCLEQGGAEAVEKLPGPTLVPLLRHPATRAALLRALPLVSEEAFALVSAQVQDEGVPAGCAGALLPIAVRRCDKALAACCLSAMPGPKKRPFDDGSAADAVDRFDESLPAAQLMDPLPSESSDDDNGGGSGGSGGGGDALALAITQATQLTQLSCADDGGGDDAIRAALQRVCAAARGDRRRRRARCAAAARAVRADVSTRCAAAEARCGALAQDAATRAAAAMEEAAAAAARAQAEAEGRLAQVGTLRRLCEAMEGEVRGVVAGCAEARRFSERCAGMAAEYVEEAARGTQAVVQRLHEACAEAVEGLDGELEGRAEEGGGSLDALKDFLEMQQEQQQPLLLQQHCTPPSPVKVQP